MCGETFLGHFSGLGKRVDKLQEREAGLWQAAKYFLPNA